MANEALLALPELSYMVINIYGTRAEVTVREAVKAPELLEEDVPADVVAAADGIILDIRTDSGRAMFRDGDIVAAGEVLISGTMDLIGPEYGTTDLGYMVVHAAGSVRARTWRTLEESVPLTAGVKKYTGQERTLRSLKILWGQVDFFQNSSISWERYDKITSVKMLTVAGRQLPLGLVTTEIWEYTVEEGRADTDAAARRLEQVLTARLAALMDANEGTVLRTDVVERVTDGVLTVTLLAECEEEIGRTVKRPGETGRFFKE